MKPPYPSGTVTFLFSDIEGSTRLWEHDAAAMRPALERHDAIMRAAIEEHRGVVFKTVGDAFCAAFSQADDALAAAVNAQRVLSEYPWAEQIGRIRVRMGIHTGAVVASGGDYFGPTVNRVARLMSIGYGEQILVSGATASLLRDVLPGQTILRDLGTQRLKDLSEPEPTYQVVAPGLRTEFPALRSVDARPNNLPFQISTFVGRKRELAAVQEALAAHRLVTIVGLGGIGKTRLALQAAADAIDGFADGAWVVQLSPVLEGGLIGQTVADVLGVREVTREPIHETVARLLAKSATLLVFDGSEHLLAPVAAFVKTLLSRCASVKVLVTSREALHITGENVIRVEALDDAAALFIDRAREVRSALELDAPAMEIVAEICRRVEGIPLAVELAAARAATLPLRELSARLSKRLPLLVSRDTTKEERHRTLRGTIAWSHTLLDGNDDAVFRTLGVFEGSFDVAAVAAVGEGDEDHCFEVMEALVAKSLVSTVPTARTTRYLLLDTVREYLVDLPLPERQKAEFQTKYFVHYAALAASQRSAGEDVGGWLDDVDVEISNLRAALEWGIRERPSDAAALAAHLSRYWKIRGRITEGRTWFGRLLATPLQDAARAALLRRAATFATEQDDYDEAQSFSAECRTLYETLGDINGVGEALHNLAVIEQRRGGVDTAAGHFAGAIERFRRSGNDYGESLALLNMVLLAFARDDLDEAQRRIDEAAVVAARMENVDLRATVTAARGSLALRRGDVEGAVRLNCAALEVKRALGHRDHVADIQNTLANAYLRQGRRDEALAFARASLRLALELEASWLVIYGFEAFCEIAAGNERFEEAARYCGLAQALRRAHTYWSTNARKMDDIENVLRARLGDRFDAILAGCADADWRRIATELAGAP